MTSTDRRSFIGASLVATATLGRAGAALGQTGGQDMADAIHKRLLVLDGHADVLLPASSAQYYHVPDSYLLPGKESRIGLRRLIEGGVDAIMLTVAVGPGPTDAEGIATARAEGDRKLSVIRSFVADNSDRVGLALSARDIVQLHGQGKIAVLIGFQNARMIGEDIDQLDIFYEAGVRVFALNHAGHNAFSDSSRFLEGAAAPNGGLSPLGRRAISRLNDLGAVIDVSQTSSAAFFQTLELTRAPVAATHSNAGALAESIRNLTDDQLDAIKANGGIVQVTPFAAFLLALTPDQKKAIGKVRSRYGLSETFTYPSDDIGRLTMEQRTAYIEENGALTETFPKPTVSHLVDHIDYIARRIGVKHVGIGTDFDHGSGIPGFNSASDAPNVTRELLRRGYAEDQIAAIWSGNFLRVFQAASDGKVRA